MTTNICRRAPGGAVYLPWMNERQKEAELCRGAMCTLTELGVPNHLKGCNYLVTAIMLAADDPSRLNDRSVRFYSDVAAAHGENYVRVEKCIRTVIETMFSSYKTDKLYDYFGGLIKEDSGKVTNTDFIRRVAEDVRADVMSRSLDENRKRLLSDLGLRSEIPE